MINIYTAPSTDGILAYIQNQPGYEYMEQAARRVEEHGLQWYLVGGGIRDAVAAKLFAINPTIKDFDLLVDDSKERVNFKGMLSGYAGVTISRLGSPKWLPKQGIEIDIVPFSNATKLRNGEKLPVNLETALSSCEFLTSALVFDFRTEAITSHGAYEAIQNRTIEIQYREGEEAHVLMGKAVLLERKLQFKIGDSIRQLIVEEYSSCTRQQIDTYLRRKGNESEIPYVYERLEEIKENPV